MARLAARDWILAAAAQVGRAGVDSVRVERLAKTLGVSKGSFYWHFTDRAALLEAVVKTWEQEGTAAIIDAVEAVTDDPATRLHALFERIFGTPSQLDAFEGAVRAWAVHDSTVKDVVRGVDRQRLRFVAELLRATGIPAVEARRRAQLLYCVLIGEYVQRGYGKSKLDRPTLASLHAMLLAPPEER